MISHPWLNKFPIPSDTKYLILGTHPPMPYKGNFNFYYGNSKEFWRFLSIVYSNNSFYKEGILSLDNILAFLYQNKIWISDIVEETNGTPFSIDDDMKWTMLNNTLKDVLIEGSVEIIYFTSFGGKNSALNLFKRLLKMNGYKNIKIPYVSTWRNKGLIIQLNGKKIKLEVLFSPSPTARRSANRVNEFQDWIIQNPNSNFDEFRVNWYKFKLPKL